MKTFIALLVLAVGMAIAPPMANGQSGPYISQISYLGRCNGTDYCWEFDLNGGDHTCGIYAAPYPYYLIDTQSQTGTVLYQGVSGYSYSFCQVNITYSAEIYEWCLENYDAGCDFWNFHYWDSNTQSWTQQYIYLFFQH